MSATVISIRDGDEDPPGEQCCGNCRCYLRIETLRRFRKPIVKGICRLYPPLYYVETTADEWCGQWMDAVP